jgi:hypothetical protein
MPIAQMRFFLSDGIAEEMRFTCLIAALRI